MRRSVHGKLALLFLLVGIATLALAPSAPAASGGACQLDGTASFGSGLNTTTKPFDYSFNGTLSNCQSNVAGSPTSGTVSAGEVYTDPATGKQYQMPRSQGNGSCASSTTSGTAVAFWADGTRTVVAYDTTGAAAAVQLQGSVAGSVTLAPVNPLDAPLTLATTRYGGYAANGALVFEASPQDCASDSGVLAAGIAGSISLSSPN
jgi:hypothetical protein